MYFSIYNAEGPVGTYRFLNIIDSSLSRYAIIESRKWSISFLSVGKPFFFFEFIAYTFLTFGLTDSL
jgi:hypothetical protein